MKGIAHFLAGVAVATFFPEVVTNAAHSLTFGPVLGGIAGLLPDALDFRFVRYFDRVDEEIDPGQRATQLGHPDPQAMAERIAEAMNRAYETGKRVKIHIHTVRLGADLWRQTRLTFDVMRNEVVVRIGPIVTTGQVPLAGSEISGLAAGRAPVEAPMLHTYDEEVVIDIFSGPSLAFERENGAVRITFLPWHRAWTHSLLLAVLVGAAGLLVSPVVGLAMTLAVLAHIVTDQMGFMGSNLFFPFTKRRTMGWRLFRSGDTLPNFLSVWLSLAIILLNLDRFSEAPMIPPLPYLVLAVLVPSFLFLGWRAWSLLQRLRQPAEFQTRIQPAVLAAVEALDETAEADL
jgi:membrane-bound metal-dependent hydrolase YbcI (DUF457 family)